jgi:hypothetical protein
MNLPKVELSDLSKKRVRECIEWLKAGLEAAPVRTGKFKNAVVELEDLAGQLAADIELLKPHAVRSDDAAGKLHAKETRLREVTAELERAREALRNLKPFTLVGTGEILRMIASNYTDQLPSIIHSQIRFIDPQLESSSVLVKVCGAWRVVRFIINRSYMVDTEPATPESVDQLVRIFERALRGQPYLGEDQEEYFQETATDEAPQTAAADKQDQST